MEMENGQVVVHFHDDFQRVGRDRTAAGSAF